MSWGARAGEAFLGSGRGLRNGEAGHAGQHRESPSGHGDADLGAGAAGGADLGCQQRVAGGGVEEAAGTADSIRQRRLLGPGAANALLGGGNGEAALLAGLPVTRIKVLVFVLQGLVTGFAGVMLASRMSLGDPKTSVGLELGVISACVLGGVSLTGGVATISGVLVGVLIMGSVQDAMSLLNVPTFYQYLIRGGILLLAVLFDHLRRSRRVH